ncbi:hypothetical protein LZ554_004503 [Drepanopeziza brunnea f. sp. 'monogermtubi']|nr:hypothetical protein LZ554_004503 [Drepanopeziza brunnea f. sp. 'monogermtubi']
MDRWEAEVQRHKRTFNEMSHSATLSPTPALGFGGSNLDFVSPRRPPAPNNNPRIRPSHPHNLYSRRTSEEMAERSQHLPPPRLEHRASQTIIDLTDDTEELSVPPRNNQAQSRPFGPPRLDRSDGGNMDNMIDLTEDSPEQDVIFTHARQRQLPLPRMHPAAAYHPAAPRADSPTLFLPQHQPPGMNRAFANHAFQLGLAVGPGRFGGAASNIGPGIGMGIVSQRDIMDHLNFAHHAHHLQQAMPNGLNYQNAAFAERKPEHVAPPPAREGFTRSPKGDDEEVIICPCCEEELVQNNDKEGHVVKKSGKPPSKKEREEHPFWVVKECGHVFCNKCFQDRTKHGFTEKPQPGVAKRSRVLLCAVEDCDSDVKSKDKWVGVFL